MPLGLDNSTVIEHIVTNPLAVPIFVHDATVTVIIQDASGVDLPGESWPVELPYVAGSDGVYRKTFEPFINLVEGAKYTVTINVVGLDGLKSECISIQRAITRIC